MLAMSLNAAVALPTRVGAPAVRTGPASALVNLRHSHTQTQTIVSERPASPSYREGAGHTINGAASTWLTWRRTLSLPAKTRRQMGHSLQPRGRYTLDTSLGLGESSRLE